MPAISPQAPSMPPLGSVATGQQMLDAEPGRLRQAYDFASEHARNVFSNPALYLAAGHVAVKALEANQIIFRDGEGDYVLNTGELRIQLEDPGKAAKNLAKNAVKPAAEQAAGHILHKLTAESAPDKSGKKPRI